MAARGGIVGPLCHSHPTFERRFYSRKTFTTRAGSGQSDHFSGGVAGLKRPAHLRGHDLKPRFAMNLRRCRPFLQKQLSAVECCQDSFSDSEFTTSAAPAAAASYAAAAHWKGPNKFCWRERRHCKDRARQGLLSLRNPQKFRKSFFFSFVVLKLKPPASPTTRCCLVRPPVSKG